VFGLGFFYHIFRVWCLDLGGKSEQIPYSRPDFDFYLLLVSNAKALQTIVFFSFSLLLYFRLELEYSCLFSCCLVFFLT
jgi:hypothetical protein